MEQKQQLSKPVTLAIGAATIGIGTLTIFMGLNLTGAVLLVIIGVVGITAGLMGDFKD